MSGIWHRLARGSKFVLFACSACLAMGCESTTPTRYEVTGTVQYDGAPVPAGYIVFEPYAAQGNHGPGAGAKILDGRFTTESAKGIVGGPHIVRIHGTDGVPVDVPGEGLDPNGTTLFPDYETRVEFPQSDTAHDFMVPR